MSATVKLEGFKELERELDRLQNVSIRKASARRVLKKVATPLAEAAKGKAPRRVGHLAESIKVGGKVSGPNEAKSAFAEVMRSGGSREQAVAALRDVQRQSASLVQISVGPGRHPQAITQEFGTRFHAAQPFMRPAWDEQKGQMLGTIKRELWADIEKAVARAEAKAARLAAKG